ncbi:hypothetical protein [Actinomadura sp. NAK00032]|uniref:hypothetical protein n=1 Tax=Actinomadura sp. NAK00032 TaxID=2742128 RepID=UPI001C37A3D7|nr:hypothetical protein [Actinomadura sp. NAK00032]
MFSTTVVKGRVRVLNVWVRPGAAVPIVVSAPVPPPATGLRNWNVRLALVLVAAFVLLVMANEVTG